MKSLYKLFIIVVILISSSNVHAYEPSKVRQLTSEIEKVKWLIGTWANHTSSGVTFESWTMNNNYELVGKSYIVNGLDTVVFETIRIVQSGNGIQYIPTVKNQNEGNPVVFNSIYISNSKFIVEAPKHDFPKVISYTLISPDQLVAEISGEKGPNNRYQTFLMKRVKPED